MGKQDQHFDKIEKPWLANKSSLIRAMYLYVEKHFLSIYSNSKLQEIIDRFELNIPSKNDSIFKKRMLLKELRKHQIFKDWSNFEIAFFLMESLREKIDDVNRATFRIGIPKHYETTDETLCPKVGERYSFLDKSSMS